MEKIKIAASVLAADFSRLYEQVKEAEGAGVDWLHFDVMDGHFVPNITFGAPIVESLRDKTNLFFDVHLMIENPDKYIAQFVKAGADLISVHYEIQSSVLDSLRLIRESGVKAAIAISPPTPLNNLSDEILKEIDMILIMTVNPGWAGQKFIEEMILKIEETKKLLGNSEIDLQVDGGINAETAPKVVSAGANILVAASAIFNQERSIKDSVYRLRESLKNLTR